MLCKAPLYGAAFVAGVGLPMLAEQGKPKAGEKGEEEFSTNEDLMRENGILNSYPCQSGIFASEHHWFRQYRSEICRGYHEKKLEESYLFLRFRKAGKLVADRPF